MNNMSVFVRVYGERGEGRGRGEGEGGGGRGSVDWTLGN